MLQAVLSTLPMFVCGFWFLTIILDRGRTSRAQTMLALFMFASFLVFFAHAYYFNHGQLFFLAVESLYTLSSLLVYPLFFLYLSALTEARPGRLGEWLILTPSFLFFILVSLIFLLMPEQETAKYLNYVQNHTDKAGLSGLVLLQVSLIRLSRLVYIIQIIPVVIFGVKKISRYQQDLENYYSSPGDRSLWWARNMLYVLISTSMVSASFTLIGRTVFDQALGMLLIPSGLFSVLLYIIGYVGYHQRFTAKDFAAEISITDDTAVRPEEAEPNLREKLIRMMEKEQVYTREDLRISDLALLLGTNRTYLSNIVNHELGLSFSDFINSYRVKHAKRLLMDTACKHFSIKGVGESSGFSNEASFFRVFKKENGQSPAAWRSSVRAGS